VQLAEALRRSGRAEEALTSAQAGLDWARQSGAPQLLTQAHQAVAFALSDLGRSEDALAFLEREGVEGGELLQNIRSLRAVAGYNEGVRAIEAGDYSLAIARFSALAEDPRADAARRETAQRSLQSALGLAAQAEVDEGRSEAAQGLYERALAVAQDRTDLSGQANLHLRLSVLRSGVEDPGGAAEYAGQAAALADQAGLSRLAGQAWTMLGDLRFESEAAAAQEAYRRALAAWGQDETVLGRRANVAYNLAALEAHNGDPEAALAQFAEAKELAKRAGDQGLVAKIDQVLQQLETE
jgi:tetratricopeptide (TPR) repeat protein